MARVYVIQVAGMDGWVDGAWLGPQWDSYNILVAIAIIHGNKIPFQVTLMTSKFIVARQSVMVKIA